jgi:hypothetical protein
VFLHCCTKFSQLQHLDELLLLAYVSCCRLTTSKGMAEVKAAGRYRQEGKAYVVEDGDIIHFRECDLLVGCSFKYGNIAVSDNSMKRLCVVQDNLCCQGRLASSKVGHENISIMHGRRARPM